MQLTAFALFVMMRTIHPLYWSVVIFSVMSASKPGSSVSRPAPCAAPRLAMILPGKMAVQHFSINSIKKALQLQCQNLLHFYILLIGR